MRTQGHAALVTGASGGLGREFVEQLLERGATKVYAASRTPGRWTDGRVTPLALDVTDPAAVASAAAAAPEVSLVINNAGTIGEESLLTASMDAIRRTFDTNVFGPLLVARAFSEVLGTNGGGAFVNIHSLLSWLTTPGSYAPSKAAAWGVTNALRVELAPQSTQVVGAHFAYVDTPMTADVDVPKSTPGDIVATVLDGLEAGATEVLADALTAEIHGLLPTMSTGAPSSSPSFTGGE